MYEFDLYISLSILNYRKMKKVMWAVIAMLGFAVSGFAQEGLKKPAKKADAIAKEVKQEIKTVKNTDATAKAVKQEVKTADKKAKDTKVVLKKDGAPDKR